MWAADERATKGHMTCKSIERLGRSISMLEMGILWAMRIVMIVPFLLSI